MKRLFTPLVAAALVAAGLAACSSPTTKTVPNADGGTAASLTPSISAVIPGKAYQGRTTDVTIAGYATSWDSTATVDFGAGVTVNSVNAASPTSLIANVTVAASATVGARDVVVHQGSTSETYKGGFQVAAADGSVPSVSAINPPAAFLARSKDVLISGSNTLWSSLSMVDFGAGVTVNKITVASPTALRVNISVGATAAAGWRDVSVTTAGETDTFSKSFDIESPVLVTTEGTVAQGSLIHVKIRDMDPDNLFDTTSTGDGFFTPFVFTNLNVTTPAGVTFAVQNVTSYEADGIIGIDVNAMPGSVDLTVLSGKADAAVPFPAPAALSVAARTASALNAATPATGSLATPYGSALYSFTPASMPQLIDIIATASTTTAAPQMILLPKSGAFADAIAQSATLLLSSTAADTYYVIYLDQGSVAGYTYLIKATASAVALFQETEPNNTVGMANMVPSLPVLIQNAKLENAMDVDYFSISVAAGDVGKHVRVITTPGDQKTNTLVDVVSIDPTDMTTQVSAFLNGPPSQGTTYHQDVRTDALTSAGVYYVKISANTSYDPMHTAYNAIVRLE
jgi:hypothetical protein